MKFSEYEDKASELYSRLRERIAGWSEEDKNQILTVDDYQYIVIDENTDANDNVSYVTFCIGPQNMTDSEKDDVGYSTFTFDRCRCDVGGHTFDARDVVLNEVGNIDLDTDFANLETLRRVFQTRIITAAF